jgi:hypothetical protein
LERNQISHACSEGKTQEIRETKGAMKDSDLGLRVEAPIEIRLIFFGESFATNSVFGVVLEDAPGCVQSAVNSKLLADI